MKTAVYILLCCFAFVFRAVGQSKPDYTVRPDGKAVLQIDYRNNKQVRPLFSYTEAVLPYDAYMRIEDSIPLGTGWKFIMYAATSPQTALLTISQYGAPIFIVPGDTLTLSIDLSKPDAWHSYQFIGQYAPISQYYSDKVNGLKCIPMYARAQFANDAATLTQYRQQMDSLLRVEQQFLRTYTREHALPDWFIRDEQQRIAYNDASLRTNAVSYREFSKKDKPGDLPKDFLKFVTPAVLNNPAAAHLPDYQHFLKDYFYQLYFRQKANKNIADFVAKLATQNLTGAAWDVFMTRYIDEILAGLPTEGEKLVATYQSRFKNKAWINQRVAYYKDAYTLKLGKVAPNFALVDSLDSLSKLTDYKGQVVYLSFWFTGCAPCRQEMPHENELVNYFKGKPVKVVSVCVMSSREDWLKVSNLYKLQTVNLYANKAWEKTVTDKYNVKSYPHYVLIDQQGRVVNNNTTRPSANARQEIEALLK